MKLGIAIIVCIDVGLVIFGISWKSSQGTGPSRYTVTTNQETVAVMNKSSTDADFIYESESGPIYRSQENVQSEVVYSSGPYRVRLISYMRGFDEFLILRDGKIVHHQVEDNGQFFGGTEADERDGIKYLAVPAISDINRNGIPDLVVRRQSSGNHCCCVYHIFELGKELKRIGEYSAANINNTSIFLDGDSDGVLEIRFDEWIIYSFMAMAEAIHKPVTLRWRNGGYHVAVDVMRNKRMTDKELAESASELRAGIATDRVKRLELAIDVVDLLYGGNGDQALRYIELAWPAKVEGKADFIQGVKNQLANDPYVREMMEARKGK